MNFSTVDININSQVWEGQFIEILNIETNKTLIIGNLYRSPHNTNDLYQTFINEFIPILEHLQRVNREVIIAGDFNIDLLKINENATLGDYFNSLVAQSFFRQITLPTRFSDRNCTIIDNFLCKLTHNFKPSTTGILISRISDHLPYFIFLDFITAKRDYIKKTIQIQMWNAHCINQFQSELNNASIYNLPNKNTSHYAMSNLTNTNMENHPGYQMACCVLYHTEINFI